MFRRNKAEGASGVWGIFKNVPGYAILASLWVFASHFVFDILLGGSPHHAKYETIADAVLAVPTTLIVFLLLRRELLARVQVEKDRDARARRLTHILKSANDAIIGVDQDQEIFLFNHGAELIFGYRREEVYGRPIQALLPSESAGLFRQAILGPGATTALAYGNPASREAVARRRDGTEFPAEISFSRLEEDGCPILTIVLRDVTQRKVAEAALLKSHQELETRVLERTSELRDEREKLTRILDAMPDGISVVTPEGRIEYLNPALERDFGPVAGRKCHEYFQEEPHECPDCPGGNGKAREIVSTEWISSATGKTYERIKVPLASFVGSVARLEILHDISRRRAGEKEKAKLQAEIQAHRQLFQTIVQNATVGIAVFDGDQLRLKWVNPSMRNIMDERFRHADVTGLHLDEIAPGVAAMGLTDLFREVARSGQPHFEPEYEYNSPRRGVTYWQWSLLPLPAAGKEIPDLMVLANEITASVLARRRVEEFRIEEERRAEALRRAYGELELRSRELSALLVLSRQLTSTLDLQPLFELILKQLLSTFGCESATILVQDKGEILIAEHIGQLPEERDPGMSATLRRALNFEQAFNRHDPLIVQDLWADNGMAEGSRGAREESPLLAPNVSRSWMVVPMLVKDRVAGLFRLEHSRPGHFAQHHARLALAMANQAGIAIENARLYRAARKVAALEERQRLARELHDSVTQALYAIALGAHTAREILGEGPDRLKDSLDSILALAQTAVSEMRFLIFELRPDYLENETLSTTLARLADAVRGRYGCDVRLDLTSETDFPFDLKESLYRICHEAVTNAARHAGATVASIGIREENGDVVLVVEDDGIGFDPGASFPGHLGLQSMRERAAELGGLLEIESSAGRGTTVRARFPRGAGQSTPLPQYSDQARTADPN
jgi:PAS domain S-box-containing protein